MLTIRNRNARNAVMILVAMLAVAMLPSRLEAADPATTAKTPAGGDLGYEKATCPEVVVYTLMRRLENAKGSAAFDIRDEIDTYRAMVQDRKRKVNRRWTAPAEFKRRREQMDKKIKDAQAILRKPAKTDADKKRLALEAHDKAVEGVRAWPDPLLREFAIAAAEVADKTNVAHAEEVFRRCIDQAPLVAAFHQGRGLALLELKRPLDALAEFTQVLRLLPDSPDALQLVVDGVSKVPGTDIRKETFLDAKKLLKQYDAGKTTKAPGNTYGSKSIRWLLPGKGLAGGFTGYSYSSGAAINVQPPPYDRLVFRQALAVPMAKNMLLVDESALEGALEIYVKVDKDRFVPAKVRKSGSAYGYGAKPNLPPLAMLEVDEYEFTPLKGDKKTAFDLNVEPTIHGLNSYREMGDTVRTAKARIAAIDADGGIKLSGKLLAGEVAGPVVTRDGVLMGFLRAKTHVDQDDGGADDLIQLKTILPMIEQAAKPASIYGGSSYGKPKRQVTTMPAKGRVFPVTIITAEGPEK